MPRVPREMRAGSTVSFRALSMLLGLSPPCGTLFPQLTDDTKEHSQDHKAELSQCILLQGKERRCGDAPWCPGSSLPQLRNGGKLLANAGWDFLPTARICPEETILFLESQLGHEREAVRVAALGLLGALARCDGQYCGVRAWRALFHPLGCASTHASLHLLQSPRWQRSCPRSWRLSSVCAGTPASR